MDSLEQLILKYHPTDATAELVDNTKISLLVGITGAGKDTIKAELLKNSDYQDIVSHTTRGYRVNNGVKEVDGKDYHFISEKTARKMVLSQQFIEAKFVHGTVYGTAVSELQKAHDQDKIAINDLDVQGVDEYKNLSPNASAIFILPPSYDIWLERLSQRYKTKKDFAREWNKRRLSAINELTRALEVPYYHFIINDELDRAVSVVDDMAHNPDDTFYREDDEARLMARDLLETIEANR